MCIRDLKLFVNPFLFLRERKGSIRKVKNFFFIVRTSLLFLVFIFYRLLFRIKYNVVNKCYQSEFIFSISNRHGF